MTFEIRRRENTARENAVAKTWREAFDLLFDGVTHVARRSVRDVTISPQRMLTRRRAGCIEERWLGDEDERLFGVATVRRIPL